MLIQQMGQKTELDLRHELAQKSILIVDDEAIIRDLCSKALKGYRVVEAADGQEALQIFEREPVDVILTDVMMPQMNGIELLRRLKEKEPTLVVIVMTGYAEKDVILNALKADADDFITKPLNLLQLKTAVDKALVKKALKEEIADLRRLDHLKSNFLSLVSHKFRTPITAISLFLQNLDRGVYDMDDPSFKENLKLIYQESGYLEYLVSDLLAFSRVMEGGRAMERTPTDLKGVITEVMADSRESAKKPGLKTVCELDDLPPLALDREKIAFALRQVIDNAYKFSTDSGTVQVTLKNCGDSACIVVADTGIGITPEDLPKVFEKFYQVDEQHTGQIRGFGLGLYYAREFVRNHGGTITIESERGAGTSVTIAIPFA